MSQLVRELKRKRDEEARLAQRSPLPVFQETEGGQTIKTPEQVVVEAVTALNNLKNAVTLQAGDNVTVTVNGQTITIAGLDNILTGSVEPTSLLEGTLGQFYLEEYTPKLYICTAISEGTYTWTEVGAGGGESYTLPQATESELGGVKAKTRTTETAEIAIDTATGKLYGTAPDEAANGLPAGGEAGQVLAKASSVDYNAEWIDVPSGGGLMQSHVGMYIPTVPTSGLTAREAIWQRFIALKPLKVTSIDFAIFALTGSIRLLIYETNNWVGSGTKGTMIYAGSYEIPPTPPSIHKFSGLDIDLEKDKIYAFVLESQTGTTLQGSNNFDLNVWGYGSLLPASAKGGYTTRASATLTEYGSSNICMIVSYE